MTSAEKLAAADRKAKIGLGVAGAALGAVIASQEGVMDLHPQQSTEHVQQMSGADVAGMNEKGPHGASISMSPETGHPVVNIDLKEKVTDIDLRHPIKEMKAPE